MVKIKKKLNESEAVRLVTQQMIAGAMRAWPRVFQNIQLATDGKIGAYIRNEEQAVFDLMLACSAVDLQVVRSLFPREQAARLETKVYAAGHSEKYGDYAQREVRRYSEEFQKEIGRVENGGDPLGVIAGLLLYRWLGDGLAKFVVPGLNEETISPILVDAVVGVVCSPYSGVGTWKEVAENFDLIEDK
jgi:hypothetical protein